MTPAPLSTAHRVETPVAGEMLVRASVRDEASSLLALIVAVPVIACELLTLAWIRARPFGTGFVRSSVSGTLGGALGRAAS